MIEVYLSDFNYLAILGIASDGINAIATHSNIKNMKAARGFEHTT